MLAHPIHDVHTRLRQRRRYAATPIRTGGTVDMAGAGSATATRSAAPHGAPGRRSAWEDRLLGPTSPTEATLMGSPVEDIIGALLAMRDPRGWSYHGQDIDRHGRIIQLVRHLLEVRGQPASPLLYECIMDAMIEPKGSAKGMRRLLDDISVLGMKPTEAMCRSALAVLANHPDYVLRQSILAVMQEFWFTVDTSSRQSVVLGLLRDGQYELAYARLLEKESPVEGWTYDIFIMVFGKLGFVDEMMQLLRRRKMLLPSDGAVPRLLHYALDVCSRYFHHAGTVYCWNGTVKGSPLQVPDGIVENVLATAARHGDASLATEALDMIAQRTRVLAYHYEAVAESFVKSGDMVGALRVLCIMKGNGICIGRGNTRAMHAAMRRKPKLIGDVESALRSLDIGGQAPAAVVDLVLEATAEIHGGERAMDLYGDVVHLCGEPAGARAMQALIMHSRDGETRNRLMQDYMRNVTEEDDPVRYPREYARLISACAEAGQMDLAFRFAAQAVSASASSATGEQELTWVKALVEQAVACEDGRIWDVVDKLSSIETRSTVQRVLQQSRLARRAAQRKEVGAASAKS
ncbi:hypothetical protein RJ55_07965 [Drechmeria coniospora]|nr:hypothetical protein RJ55_07965 [Drechmeria coniospora]